MTRMYLLPGLSMSTNRTFPRAQENTITSDVPSGTSVLETCCSTASRTATGTRTGRGTGKKPRPYLLVQCLSNLPPAVLHVMAILMVDRPHKMQQRGADHPDLRHQWFRCIPGTASQFGSSPYIVQGTPWLSQQLPSTAWTIQVFQLRNFEQAQKMHTDLLFEISTNICYGQRWRRSTAICTWADFGRSRVAFLRHRWNA